MFYLSELYFLALYYNIIIIEFKNIYNSKMCSFISLSSLSSASLSFSCNLWTSHYSYDRMAVSSALSLCYTHTQTHTLTHLIYIALGTLHINLHSYFAYTYYELAPNKFALSHSIIKISLKTNLRMGPPMLMTWPNISVSRYHKSKVIIIMPNIFAEQGRGAGSSCGRGWH